MRHTIKKIKKPLWIAFVGELSKNEGMTLTQVYKKIGSMHSQASKILNYLEINGFLKIEMNDGRSYKIYFSDDKHKQVAKELNKNFEYFMRHRG